MTANLALYLTAENISDFAALLRNVATVIENDIAIMGENANCLSDVHPTQENGLKGKCMYDYQIHTGDDFRKYHSDHYSMMAAHLSKSSDN